MLKKDEYLKTVRRPYPPLFCTLVCMGYRDPKVFAGILNEQYCITQMGHVDEVWYYGKFDMLRGGQLALVSWQDPKVFEHVKKEFKQREDTLIDSTTESFEAFAKAYQDYMVTLNLVFSAEKPVDEALRDALSAKVQSEEVGSLMSRLNVPFQDNIFKKEEYDLVQATDLAEHVKKYNFLNARYGDQTAYTLEEAQDKLKKIDKEKFLREWKESKEELQKVIAEAKALVGGKDILVDIFQYLIYYRTHRTDTMNRAQYLCIPMLKLKAELLNITYAQLLECTAEEVFSGSIPDISILDSRAIDSSVMMEDGKIRCATGEESTKLKEYFSEEVVQVNEFKGNVAFKGKITGRVAYIKDKTDFSKIKEGDILVTSMTTPEMVPAMKLAAAFITDEGGVTCHAAIVAREMKKPCIIGTKIATKVLKDGDMVEVDAEKGIVTILQ